MKCVQKLLMVVTVKCFVLYVNGPRKLNLVHLNHLTKRQHEVSISTVKTYLINFFFKKEIVKYLS